MQEKSTGKITEVAMPNKWQKFQDWSKTKLFPWLNKTGNSIVNALEAFGRRLLKIRVSWVAILAFVILASMAQNGNLDKMPELKWLIESSVRLIEWFVGLIRQFIKWTIDFPKLDFGIFEMFNEWIKEIFAV